LDFFPEGRYIGLVFIKLGSNWLDSGINRVLFGGLIVPIGRLDDVVEGQASRLEGRQGVLLEVLPTRIPFR